MKTTDDLLKAHFFQVAQPDGTSARVIIFAKRDGTIGRITDGHLLAPFIGPAPNKPKEDLPGLKISKDKEKRDVAFFDEKVPCWFEGCQELRDEYATAADQIKNSGSPCIPCDLHTLMRQYLVRLSSINTDG